MHLQDLIEECAVVLKEKGFDASNIPAQLLLIATEAGEALENVKSLDPALETRCTSMRTICTLVERERESAEWGAEFEWFGGELRALHGKNGVMEELADILIRVISMVGANNWTDDFLKALRSKIDYNKLRPYKHGKKN